MRRRPEPADVLELTTLTEEETRLLGERCGRLIPAPAVLALIGELGCGKTVFVQGLARGLEVPPAYVITSPSFTLINEYPGRLPLFHIDLYRLDEAADLEDLGLIEVLTGEGVAAVEWADKLPAEALSERLEVHFTFGEADSRKIRLAAYGQESASLLHAVDRQRRKTWD
jgi:tRNA threonylcarbamoyladenosine biosynthesis protein TsaE